MNHSIGPTLTTERLILRPPLARGLRRLRRNVCSKKTPCASSAASAPRDAAWRGMAMLARLMVAARLFDVLRTAPRHWRMDRPSRSVASGRQGRLVAGQRSRLGLEEKRGRAGLRARRRDRRDGLGVRYARLGSHHPLHRQSRTQPSIALALRLGSQRSSAKTYQSRRRSRCTKSISTANPKRHGKRGETPDRRFTLAIEARMRRQP